MNKTSTTTKVTRHEITLTGFDITKALGLPATAKVWITVPSGADWSGMTLEIGKDLPLEITYEEKEVKGVPCSRCEADTSRIKANFIEDRWLCETCQSIMRQQARDRASEKR